MVLVRYEEYVDNMTLTFNQYPDLHVIQIDAHADLRDSWNGSPYSHACVMQRVIDLGVDLTQIGIRNLSQEGFEFISTRPSLIKTWRAKQLKEKENLSRIIGIKFHKT